MQSDKFRFPQGDVVVDFIAAIEFDMSVVVIGNVGDVNGSLGTFSIHALASPLEKDGYG